MGIVVQGDGTAASRDKERLIRWHATPLLLSVSPATCTQTSMHSCRASRVADQAWMLAVRKVREWGGVGQRRWMAGVPA